MDISKKYIEMCEKAPRELWDEVEHCGSIIAWRSFIGIVMPDPDERKWGGLASVIPETLVLRTWLKEGEETIIVLKTNVDYGGSDGDKGTPLYRQDQLQEMLDFNDPYALLRYVSDFAWEKNDSGRGYKYPAAHSTEQLWLAFVMMKKWNKTWNGKQWVKLEEALV